MVTNTANKIISGCASFTSSIQKMTGKADLSTVFSTPTIDPIDPSNASIAGPTVNLSANKYVHAIVGLRNLTLTTSDPSQATIEVATGTVNTPIQATFGQAIPVSAANDSGEWTISYEVELQMFDGKTFWHTVTIVRDATELFISPF